MFPSNGGSEPQPVIPNVAVEPNTTPAPAANNNNPFAAQVPPPVLSAEDILKELSSPDPTPAPHQGQNSNQDSSPDFQKDNKSRDLHKQRFEFQLKTNLLKVEKAVERLTASGKDVDEAFEEALDGVPEHLQNNIRKLYNGESLDNDQQKNVDYNVLADNAVEKKFALRDSQEILAKAFEENKLNLATAQALAVRQSITADYKRLLKTNLPQEAARFALFNAGITNKKLVDEAFNSGVLHANQGAPVLGSPGTPPAGNFSQEKELTAEQIKNAPLDKLIEHDKKITQKFNTSSPVVMMPMQGNPNVV